MTPYALTHRFSHTHPRVLLAAFTHPAHQALQDQNADVLRREIIERVDDDARYRCECRVFPRRQLPGFVRPFVRGGLEYHEVVSWDKATDVLEIDVQPAVLGGRSRIRASARVVADGADAVRIYNGTVTVEVALVGGRIERGIIEEIGRTMDAAAEHTRAWLEAQSAQQRKPVE